jgi:topoisomerase IV subunit B
MADLFSTSSSPDPSDSYDASSIEVLEGLEPVRRRPGMYIGGTDARALHHLAAEVIDNAMDEAVAGHASRIEVTLAPGNRLTVTDNGRGIPVEEHPKYPGKSALEVIMTTLHSGGKFEGKAYSTSGGLHGVGVSVVNALSTETIVEVARDKTLYRQTFARGLATSKLEEIGPAPNRRGTTVAFTPDPEIFGADARFSPSGSTSSPAPRPICSPESRSAGAARPSSPRQGPREAVFQFPGGLADHLREQLGRPPLRHRRAVHRPPGLPRHQGSANGRSPGRSFRRLAILLLQHHSHPRRRHPRGGLRAALTKGIRAFGELVGNKRAKESPPTTCSTASS